MGRRPDTIEVLQRRRDSWAAEIGQNNEWSHLAPQFVREIEEQIESLRTQSVRKMTNE